MPDKILVIDDDESILELCRMVFEKNGYVIRLAENLGKGFETLEKEHFHAVLSDIRMPGMDGITLLEKLKEKYPELPVVLMTADSTVNLAIKALKAGASDYVIKPFDTGELINTISRVIEHSRVKKHAELLTDIISMYEFVNELTKDKTEGELLGFLLWRACKTLNADTGSIFEYDEKTEKMELKASNGGNVVEFDKERIKLLTDRNAPQIILDSDDTDDSYGISIPIMLKSNLIGIFHLNRTTAPRVSFTEDDKNVAKIFSSHAALIIEHFRSLKAQEEFNTLRSEFISHVSHELRTPLMSISGALELLSAGDSVKDRKFLDIVSRNCRRMNLLVKELLDFNRMETSTIKYSFRKFSSAAFLDKIYSDFANLYVAKGINLVKTIPKNPPEIYGDEERLIQTVSNLLSNALKFSPKGTTVSLGVSKKYKNAVFSVKDEGPGIDNAFHDKIFDKFFQVDGSSKKDAGGFGLGLSIVKSIVDAHKGRISVKSEPGKGSTFCIIIPLNAKNG
jgi:hypothetical protein